VTAISHCGRSVSEALRIGLSSDVDDVVVLACGEPGRVKGRRTEDGPRVLMEVNPMNDTDADELGPVDYIVVEFPADKADFSGAMAAELSALVKNGAVRVLDLPILKKESDGSVDAFEAHDFGDDALAELLELGPELAMLLAADDVEAIGAALEPGSVAAVLIWENVWAAPFGSAVRRSGGQLVASGRIPIQAIAAAVEADDAAMKEGV